jgi:Flp pilus assembly protein TadG
MKPAHRKSERGSELVEFAFAIVILGMLMFGVVDFGRAAFAYHFVSDSAREGTRYAIVRGAACTALVGCNADPETIRTYVRSFATAGITPSQVNVDTNWPIESNSPSVCALTQNDPGCFVRIKVSYPFHFTLLPLTTINLASQSEMAISQ